MNRRLGVLAGQQRPTAEQVAYVMELMLDHYEQGGCTRILVYERLEMAPKHMPILGRQAQALSNILNAARDSKEVNEELGRIYGR